MTNARFDELFDGPRRSPEALLTQREMNLAASVQVVLEDVVLRLTRSLAKETGQKNLCLAGGVALNCVANGKVLKSGAFDRVWVQPAAGDAGGSLGAALNAYYAFQGQARKIDPKADQMKGSFLGPAYSDEDICARLTNAGGVFTTLDDEAILDQTARELANGAVVGWFQGRMEFGPRSLGCRSILADPRSTEMQKTLNLKIKYRESFRPFAPAVLREDVADWFDLDDDSPYMLMVADVHKSRQRKMTDDEAARFGIDKLNAIRSEIPAVTHVDYSARIQTVDDVRNPKFHALLSRFKAVTGCPVLANTSFNVRGEPIVCTPEDAFRCFMGTEMDLLIIGRQVLKKVEQNADLCLDYKNKFELD